MIGLGLGNRMLTKVGGVVSSLIGEWLFSGNANDTSGNGLNGTVNGATLTTDRDGNANSAYHFNGTGQNISVADNNLLDFTDKFTIEFWCKTIESGTETIISKWNYPTNGTWMIRKQGGLMFVFIANALNDNGSNYLTFPVTYGNVWTKFKVQYDGVQAINANRVKVFENDIQVTSGIEGNGVIAQTLQNSSYQMMFGSWGYGSVYFNGDLDEIKIYNELV